MQHLPLNGTSHMSQTFVQCVACGECMGSNWGMMQSKGAKGEKMEQEEWACYPTCKDVRWKMERIRKEFQLLNREIDSTLH